MNTIKIILFIPCALGLYCAWRLIRESRQPQQTEKESRTPVKDLPADQKMEIDISQVKYYKDGQYVGPPHPEDNMK